MDYTDGDYQGLVQSDQIHHWLQGENMEPETEKLVKRGWEPGKYRVNMGLKAAATRSQEILPQTFISCSLSMFLKRLVCASFQVGEASLCL